MAQPAPAATAVRYRQPTEADHPRLVAAVDDWWGGRHVRQLLPRLWFRHFAGTSGWPSRRTAEPPGSSSAVSPDRPDEAIVHLVGVTRACAGGIGRELEARSPPTRGPWRRVTATVPPGDPIALRFHLAVAFRVVEDPRTTPIYGTPAVADYDGPGADRVLLVRDLPPD
jgi:hypothetical protein